MLGKGEIVNYVELFIDKIREFFTTLEEGPTPTWALPGVAQLLSGPNGCGLSSRDHIPHIKVTRVDLFLH